MRKLISEWKFSFLLAALLANVLLAPIFMDLSSANLSGLDTLVLQVVFTLVLITLVFIVGHKLRLVVAYSLFAVLALLFTW